MIHSFRETLYPSCVQRGQRLRLVNQRVHRFHHLSAQCVQRLRRLDPFRIRQTAQRFHRLQRGSCVQRLLNAQLVIE